jgi:2',3'-cyclic-nucleotide 2'-phosphodiesterase (5'-nucleotidase family)
MLSTAFYPFLAANLDFSNAQVSATSAPIKIEPDAGPCVAARGAVTKSCYIKLDKNVIVGIIGRAPADFFNVIANPTVTIPGVDFFGGRDPSTNQPLESAVGQVLEQVDLLEQQGAKVIILLDHAQDFTSDPLSATSLRGIDIIVQAGSTGFVGQPNPSGPFNFLREGDTPTASYPVVREDMDGNTILAVNSDQLYRYMGHLLVKFDKNGKLINWDGRSGPIATTAEAVGLLAKVVKGKKSLSKRKGGRTVGQIFADLQATPLITDAFTVVGTTSEELNGLRADVRTRETNLGRLAAESSIWAAQAYVDANGPTGVAVQMALKNGGGIRGTIEGPQITSLVVNGALAFDNKLTVVELTAAQLLAAIENAYSRYPSADGRFAQLAGLQVTFDPSKPGLEGQTSTTTPSRVIEMVQVAFDGDVIDTIVSAGVLQGDPTRTFILATNNFLTTGGDGYTSLAAASQLATTTLGEQQILKDFISSFLGGSVDIPDPPTPANVINASV